MSLDNWEKRQVEKLLAQELQEAMEEYRMAVARASQAATRAASATGEEAIEIKQSQAECDIALARAQVARSRWLDFVSHGTIPPGFEENS